MLLSVCSATLQFLTVDFAGYYGGTWVSDEMIALANANRRVIVPVNGGPAREIPAVEGLVPASSAVWVDRAKLLSFGRDRSKLGLTLQTVSGELLARRDWPRHKWPQYPPIFHNGTQSAIVVTWGGSATTGAGEFSEIYAAPIDGSTPRLLATIPGPPSDGDRPQLSPDGRTLAVTVTTAPEGVEILEIDLKTLTGRLKL
jgi:hypothetical protein